MFLKSKVNTEFRCQVAANSLDIDVNKKSIHKLKINNVKLPSDWNIGLVYGNSGSGKTTLIKHLFGEDVFSNDFRPLQSNSCDGGPDRVMMSRFSKNKENLLGETTETWQNMST